MSKAELEKTPAENQAEEYCSDFGLDYLGMKNIRRIYWNLPVEALYEEILFRKEAVLTKQGPVLVYTGQHTARAAADKFIVRESTTDSQINWGQYNTPFDKEDFDRVLTRMLGYFQGRDVFIQDCYGGADPAYRLPIRIITDNAWQSMFSRHMFVKPETTESYKQHQPQFTIIAAPGFKAIPELDKTRSETCILLNFERKLCLIGYSSYGGEIKKSVFTLLNFLFPLKGVLTMHCSANIGKDGDVALFFGLSGTGKTSLSADPGRGLIGDDQHGWCDNGIFNFEDGCYAKVIKLSPTAEPEIYACTSRFGTILENVIYDPKSRAIDLDDPRITENTRATYPLSYIANAVPEKRGGHPKNIIFLTCDASGVMPPIARLSVEQAMYHFISGYTSKIAGTEAGIGKEPKATFSACFGAPFMVHPPAFYAEMLRDRVVENDVKCWIVNTGWIGGGYGVGERISIKHTRTLLNAALDGLLDDVPYYMDSVFGFQVPESCPDIPEDLMYPARSWKDKDKYNNEYRDLALRFKENFNKFDSKDTSSILAGGPVIS